MRNYDEPILRDRRVNPKAPFPPLHQALRIALYDRYAARAFYAKVIEAFGSRAPFPAMLKSTGQHIAALATQCSSLGLPRPQDPFPLETAVAHSWSANCQRALAGEVGAARLHETLAPYAAVPEAGSLFRKIQADSWQRHVPACQKAVNEAIRQEWIHASQGVDPDEAYMQHGVFSDFLEKAFSILGSQHQAFGVVGPLLSNTRPAMLAGLLAGGAGTYLIKNKLHHKRKEK